MTDIIALLKPLLKDVTSLRWRTVQHRILRKSGPLQQSTTAAHNLICSQAVICLPRKNLRANVTS